LFFKKVTFFFDLAGEDANQENCTKTKVKKWPAHTRRPVR